MAKTLRLVRERKIAELLSPPRGGGVLEASGVSVVGRDCFVAFDNTNRIARIGADLRLNSQTHTWVGAARSGEGYEAISYDRTLGRFFALIEAQKHPDGTFKSVIEEFDDTWRFKGRHWVDFAFKKRNTGFEGLASLHSGGRHYLLALCEGNRCRRSHKRHKHGQGRIYVLERGRRVWSPVDRIKLPRHANFEDYAGLALRGDRLAVVSQESSRLWVGRVKRGAWAIENRGRVYAFPTTKKGRVKYCTVEGIAWLSATTLVAVSDLKKKRHPSRCGRTDQSIHIFSLR